jgi:hypothetical protein
MIDNSYLVAVLVEQASYGLPHTFHAICWDHVDGDVRPAVYGTREGATARMRELEERHPTRKYEVVAL